MLPPLDLHLFGGSRHRAAISSFVWQRLSLPRRHSFIRPAASPRRHLFICLAGASIAAPQSFQRAGASIAKPQSFQSAGEFHRRAAIFLVGRRIPSSRRNLFSRPANSIVVPQSFQSAGKFHCRAAIVSAGERIPSPSRQISSRPAQLHRAAILSWPAHHRRAVISNLVLSYLNLF